MTATTTRQKSTLLDPLLQKNSITSAHIFKVRAEALKELFDEKNLLPSTNEEETTSRSMYWLKQHGYVQGIMTKVATEANTGIIGDENDLKRREKFFSTNTKPLPQLPPLIASIKEALDDRILMALAIAAVFTIITGMVNDGPKWGWVQGVSIWLAILIIVTLSAANDWVKDKQFVQLQSDIKDENVTVIRGKFGTTHQVDVYSLVVGDIILLETGARVPADCLLIESQDLVVDESFYTKAENSKVIKSAILNPEEDTTADPFLLSQSMILTGVGKAVVCAVGKYSRRGMKEAKLDTETKTPLQDKLGNLGGIFTKWGIYASLAIFAANLVNMIFTFMFNSEMTTFSWTMKTLIDNLTLSITIIIVAVPEGLPLTVSLALAYSVRRMKDDQILVKNLDSPEVMGSVEEICTGKTATLTKNEMKVNQLYAQTLLIRNSRKNTLFNCELERLVIDLIIESILFNCEARIEMGENGHYEPVGNGTEIGLMKFLQDAQIPIHKIIKKKFSNIEAVIPFSAIRKRSIVAVRHPDLEDTIRVYLKGAPEFIINKCTRTFGLDGNKAPLTDFQLNYILGDIVSKEFTTKGYRALAFAYKDMSVAEFQRLKKESNNFENEQDRESLENQLTFVGAFALEDNLRDKVLRSVQYAQKGHITVRMVSGDHLETATAVAIKAGIVSEEDSKQRYSCMTGEDFRKLVGGIRQSINPDGSVKLEIQNKKEFQSIANRLRVLGRSNPHDKHLLVIGLQELGRHVAVTGDGINDVEALRASDVGFAMGSGVSLAKDAADMILTNDNFEATMNAVMWGRNIYSNVRKFIQFQVTVNFAALAFVFIGSVFRGQSPLTTVQLLWINLIMDTLAALALATERPHPSIIRNPPIKKGDQIMTQVLWRQIIGMAIYMVFVLMILLFFGELMWDIPYEKADDFYDEKTGLPLNKAIHYTILFNTFIFMQIFNEFNCRMVGPKQFNVFSNLLNNWYFIAVVGGTIALQLVFIEYAGQLMRVAPLNQQQNFACIIYGASTLLVSALLKMVPDQWTKKINIKINEDTADAGDDKIMAFYQSQAKGKLMKADDQVKPQ